ncbi:MAG: FliM/FliN family flagellar motor C-terminal domain-containing protein [Candidatus Sericytochromatia bacterium]|nr:FliM/FliN family flagellar motor C-terminal domain-containing protein [Candidatus Sericytochromatia bacterium]
MARRQPAAKVPLASQWLPLLAGLYPILLVMSLVTRGKGSPNFMLLGFWGLALAGLAAAVAHHFWYRRRLPRVVLVPPAWWKGAVVAGVMGLLGMLLLWGLSARWGLTLSHNPLETPRGWLQLAARWLLREAPEAAPMPTRGFARWVSGEGTWRGALWATVGMASAFGLGGMLASLLRKELFDPRQAPFGTAALWPFLRGLIGYYYGWCLGFAASWLCGITLVSLSAGQGNAMPAVRAARTALGFVADPDRAISHGFVAGACIVAIGSMFMGRGDFTVAYSDPRAPDREPDMKVAIPELPQTPPPDLDFSALEGETEQLTAGFGRELAVTIAQMGLTGEAGKADIPEEGTPAQAGEPPAVNLLSRRQPTFDTSFDQALGQLAGVYVQITANLGSVDVSLADWITLEEGSLLELPRAQDGTVALCINGRAVGRAKPAQYEDHVAIKVVSLQPGTVASLRGG